MIQLALICALLGADYKPSNSAKAFVGPLGEKVEVLEVNDSKQLIARVSGVGGEWEGRTFVWDYNDRGDSKEASFGIKRGSKTETYNALVFRQASWSLYPQGGKNRDGIHLSYSKEDSSKTSTEDLIKAAQAVAPKTTSHPTK